MYLGGGERTCDSEERTLVACGRWHSAIAHLRLYVSLLVILLAFTALCLRKSVLAQCEHQHAASVRSSDIQNVYGIKTRPVTKYTDILNANRAGGRGAAISP